MECGNSHPLIRQYTMLNRLCKEIGVEKQQQDSIPAEWEEHQVRVFLNELKKGSVPWKTMKVVLLGDDGVGKLTLLQQIKSQQLRTSPSMVIEIWEYFALIHHNFHFLS